METASSGAGQLTRLIASIFIFALSLSACAPAESNVSAAQNERTLRQLQEARDMDLSNAMDIAVGPVASGDYSVRADHAAQVMNELEHGQYVSRSEINEALFVPPKSLSLEQRAQLVDELRAARALDNQGWWDGTRDPVIAEDFSVQEIKANRAIKDVETNQQVSWQEIQEGLQVPQYPWPAPKAKRARALAQSALAMLRGAPTSQGRVACSRGVILVSPSAARRWDGIHAPDSPSHLVTSDGFRHPFKIETALFLDDPGQVNQRYRFESNKLMCSRPKARHGRQHRQICLGSHERAV